MGRRRSRRWRPRGDAFRHGRLGAGGPGRAARAALAPEPPRRLAAAAASAAEPLASAQGPAPACRGVRKLVPDRLCILPGAGASRARLPPSGERLVRGTRAASGSHTLAGRLAGPGGVPAAWLRQPHYARHGGLRGFPTRMRGRSLSSPQRATEMRSHTQAPVASRKGEGWCLPPAPAPAGDEGTVHRPGRAGTSSPGPFFGVRSAPRFPPSPLSPPRAVTQDAEGEPPASDPDPGGPGRRGGTADGVAGRRLRPQTGRVPARIPDQVRDDSGGDDGGCGARGRKGGVSLEA